MSAYRDKQGKWQLQVDQLPDEEVMFAHFALLGLLISLSSDMCVPGYGNVANWNQLPKRLTDMVLGRRKSLERLANCFTIPLVRYTDSLFPRSVRLR